MSENARPNGRSAGGEYRRLKVRNRTLAAFWLSAHWLSQLALFGIVLVPLAIGVWFRIFRPATELESAGWRWLLGQALLGSLACAFVLVCSVALKSHLAKRGGAANWDE